MLSIVTVYYKSVILWIYLFPYIAEVFISDLVFLFYGLKKILRNVFLDAGESCFSHAPVF